MAVLLFSFGISTATGFGTVVLAIPLCSLVLDVKLVIPLLALMSAVNATLMIAREYKHIDWREFRRMGIWIAAMFPIGNVAFHMMPVQILKILLGLFVTGVAIHGLWRLYHQHPRKPWTQNAARAILISGGLVQGATASGGPLLVVYAHHAIHNRRAFRATMMLIWVVFNWIFVVSYLAGPDRQSSVLLLGLCCVPVIPIGMWIGQQLHKRATERFFHFLVYITLLLSGISLVLPIHHHTQTIAPASPPR